MFHILEKTVDPEIRHATLVVEIEEDTLNRYKRRVARKLSQQYRIPGFRPGKAPYGMVVRHLGETLVRETLLEALLEDLYKEILEAADLDPHAPGDLKEVRSWEPLTLVFEVPLPPEVDLGDYTQFRLPYEPPQVTEEDIERALDNLRRMHVRMESVDRPAQVGDMVYMRLKGKYTPPEGEPQEVPTEEVTLLVKEDEDPEEWPFPGFSKQLVGLKKGDTKRVSYTFPEGGAMAGYTFEYEVEVLDVQQPVYPEVTDEFIRENTDYDSAEAFREGVRKHLEQERKEQYEREYRDRVLETFVEQVQVAYPKSMLDVYIEDEIEDLKRELEDQDLTLEEYLEARGITREELIEELRPRAEKRLKTYLVLSTLAEKENIKPDERIMAGLLERAAMDILEEVGDEVEARKYIRKNPEVVQQQAIRRIEGWVLARALDRLVAIAKGEAEGEEAETAEAEAPEPAESEEVQAQAPEGQAAAQAESSQGQETQAEAQPPEEAPASAAEG